MALKRFQQLQYQFAAHLRDPENSPAPPGVDDTRCSVYRRLFFNNVMGFTNNAFPVLRSLMSDDEWRTLNRQFYAQYRCHSPYFMEISAEFVRFLKEYEPYIDKLPFIDELAHYEWVEILLSACDAATDEDAAANNTHDAHDAPALSPLARLLHYRWPVHLIRPDNVPDEQAPVHMVAWRDAEEQVRFMECNEISAALLKSLSRAPGRTGAWHVRQVLEEQGVQATPEASKGGEQMLEDLHRKGIITHRARAAH